jgi:hypothetical protein
VSSASSVDIIRTLVGQCGGLILVNGTCVGTISYDYSG